MILISVFMYNVYMYVYTFKFFSSYFLLKNSLYFLLIFTFWRYLLSDYENSFSMNMFIIMMEIDF